MEPASPVYTDGRQLPDDADEIIIAEHQSEYLNLPSIVLAHGEVLTRWELSDAEIEQIVKHRSIYLAVWTFGHPLQPLMMSAEPPAIDDVRCRPAPLSSGVLDIQQDSSITITEGAQWPSDRSEPDGSESKRGPQGALGPGPGPQGKPRDEEITIIESDGSVSGKPLSIDLAALNQVRE